jgi:hypothetical protein
LLESLEPFAKALVLGEHLLDRDVLRSDPAIRKPLDGLGIFFTAYSEPPLGVTHRAASETTESVDCSVRSPLREREGVIVREEYVQDVVGRITRALNEYRRESELFESEERALLLMEKLHDQGLTIVPKRIARRTSI